MKPTGRQTALTLLVATGVVGLIMSLAMLAFSAKKQKATEIEELRAEVAELRHKSSRPSIILRETQTEPATQAVSDDRPSGEPTKEAPSAGSPALTPEQEQHRMEAMSAARLASCESTHASERPDPEWSTRAVQLIRESYSGARFEGLQFSADCRASLCRMEFSYSDPEVGMNAAKQFLVDDPWSAERFSNFDPIAKNGISYIARENFDLPPMDPASVKY